MQINLNCYFITLLTIYYLLEVFQIVGDVVDNLNTMHKLTPFYYEDY